MLEEAKNDYMREKLKTCNSFFNDLIDKTKGKSFKRTENLYVTFLTSMAKYSVNKEMMIDDVSLEIEQFDEHHPDAKKISKNLVSKEQELFNLNYFADNHKKLFLQDYYKFFGIESAEDHPKLEPVAKPDQIMEKVSKHS